MARLFLAVWPDAPARAALAALASEVARRCGGRAVPAAKLHLTLAFLGEADPARVPSGALAQVAARSAPFELALDRLGAFARAGVAWAGCAGAAPALLDLQAGAESRLREAGFALEERPFAPHLTLARHVRGPVAPASIGPVAWRVGSFALVESERGSGAYREVARWPLGAEKT
jgi:2'-5' RNA ligase